MSSYWCHRCSRLVALRDRNVYVCPHCSSGFLEEAAAPRRRRPPTTVMWLETPPRRRSRVVADRSPFNPVIVLRSPRAAAAAASRPPSAFELYYDDGAEGALRPLPPAISDVLMTSGFDRLLDQLSHLDAARPCNRPPASKTAVESMPTITISAAHVEAESHCAVCKEAFDLGADAREMPCKHIYHQECIMPWLAVRNSCPVCRHEMPVEPVSDGNGELGIGEDASAPRLTIWRLPGGGFAVGRHAAEREIPVVYTEMDGGFNNGGTPRRILWNSRGGGEREGSGVGRVFRNLRSFFSRLGTRSGRRSERNWAMEDGDANGIARW